MLTDAEARLLRSVIRTNAVITAIIGALFVGIGLWLATAILLVRGGANVGKHLSLLSIFFPGYEVTWSGAWNGALWGGVIGAVSGLVLYWSYSRTLRRHLDKRLLEDRRASLFQLPVFLISGPALGTALGLLGALQLFLSTNWLVLWGTTEHSVKAALMSNYLPGYSVSFAGSLIGSAQLFAVVFAGAFLFSGLYNALAKARAPRPTRPTAGASARRADSTHVVILGAGPAGLATAHELTANGVNVTVLEKNDYVGGLCRTVHEGGYKFDLGGHRWFTKNQHLDQWFRRLMAGHLVTVRRISRIYHGGMYFQYPLSVGDVVTKAGPLTILKAGVSFAWALVRYGGFGAPIRNMKDAYTAQFGSTLYEMFFRRYTEKVWGKPCEMLSPDWVAQRSKGLSVWSVAMNALSPRRNKVTSLVEEFVYPRDGYMRISERMAEDVVSAGGRVTLGATVRRIAIQGQNDIEVVFDGPDGPGSVRASDVVSTVPLGLLVQMLTPQPPEAALAAARSLEFRDLVTVNLKIRRQQVSADTWLYVQDGSVVFGRLHEPKNWSKAMVPDDEHTSLVLECFCTAGDALWKMSDDDIARRCIVDLAEQLRFVTPSEVEGWTVVRTRHAYPVYDLGYAEKLATIKAFLGTYGGLHIVGRGGTFRYNNADHSIEMGLLLGRRLLGHSVDHLEVNTEEEYLEEVRDGAPMRDRYAAVTAAPVAD
ncbi:MAG: FAD-dependent oxidoreductase [Burkholderiales bacterium]